MGKLIHWPIDGNGLSHRYEDHIKTDLVQILLWHESQMVAMEKWVWTRWWLVSVSAETASALAAPWARILVSAAAGEYRRGDRWPPLLLLPLDVGPFDAELGPTLGSRKLVASSIRERRLVTLVCEGERTNVCLNCNSGQYHLYYFRRTITYNQTQTDK